MQSYGADITAAVVTNQNKQTIKVTNNVEFNGTAVILITCDWNDRSTLVPTINSPHPTLTGYWLTTVDAEEMPGSICKATLTYTAQYNSLPATTFIEESSSYRESITQHPSFSSWASQYNQELGMFPPGTIISGQNFGGVSDYIVGTTTVTMTEYFDSMPDSNHTLIGQLEVPNEAYGEATNWMITGSTRQQQGYFWIRVTVFQYSAIGWNTQIYTTVGS
jgi:hypothetical protein